MVNSFFPSAALPASVAPSDQWSPFEKSSVSRILPTSGFNTSVDVTIGVRKSVGVAVGGNHTIVAVGVDVFVGVGVLDGTGSGVPAGRQALKAIEIDPTARKMNSAAVAAFQDLPQSCFSCDLLVNFDNAQVCLE